MNSKIIKFKVNESVEDSVVEIPSTMRHFTVSELAMEANADANQGIFRTIKFSGKGGDVYIGKNARIDGAALNINGNNSIIIIGENCVIKGSILVRGDNRIVLIGSNTTFHGVNILCRNDGHIYIGKDCMFSSGIEVRTSDSHAVIDTKTNEIVNKAAGVFIGDHVWVGKGVVLQKGSVVTSDNIIAINSFVRGCFYDSNTIIAGAPAKVVRTNRSWSRNESVDLSVVDIYEWKKLKLL